MSAKNATPRRVREERGIYTRPDGSYEIGWRDAGGKQRWRKVDGGIRAARRALAKAHAKRGDREPEPDNPRLTFPDAADAWWDARVVKLRPNTQNAYRAALKHLKQPEHFGRARMSDISPNDVARYVSNQQATLKGWTVKGHLTVLSSIFTYAARHLGLVGVNPVSLLDRVERPSKDDAKPKRVLSRDERTRLLNAVDDNYRVLFTLAAETGGRLAEVLGLAWEDVDLENETTTYSHQLDRNGKRRALKTAGSQRTLEVTSTLIDQLRVAKLASGQSKPHDLVFTSKHGTGHDHRNIGGRVLARAVKKAGLEAVKDRDGQVIQRAPSFHDLRHSHASALIASGWDIESVSARLGHTSVATTMSVYTHAYEAAQRSEERRSRLTALYSSAPSSMEAPVEASERSNGQQGDVAQGADVLPLSAKRSA